jgi:hypothetical protein
MSRRSVVQHGHARGLGQKCEKGGGLVAKLGQARLRPPGEHCPYRDGIIVRSTLYSDGWEWWCLPSPRKIGRYLGRYRYVREAGRLAAKG